MYFGGEIISAKDCDYQTSRDLGLTCPFCNSAVFVRSESARKIKGKLKLFQPYFAHYPSGNADDWDCEKRSHTKQGREQIERLQIQARDQRLKLYNDRLWEMFARDRNVSRQRLTKVKAFYGDRWCERQAVLWRKEWAQSKEHIYELVEAALQDIESGMLSVEDARPPLVKSSAYYSECQKQADYFMNCDRRLHRLICFEIVDFLGTNTAGFAFHKLALASLVMLALYEPPQVTKRSHHNSSLYLATISGLVVGTHWVEQINYFLNDNRQYQASKSNIG